MSEKRRSREEGDDEEGDDEEEEEGKIRERGAIDDAKIGSGRSRGADVVVGVADDGGNE